MSKPRSGRNGPASPTYWVETWDTDLQRFTPQKGVRTGPYSLFGLRKAIRKLRSMGYEADYYGRRDGFGAGDPSVSVQKVEMQPELFA